MCKVGHIYIGEIIIQDSKVGFLTFYNLQNGSVLLNNLYFYPCVVNKQALT